MFVQICKAVSRLAKGGLVACILLCSASAAMAQNVAIETGAFYTPLLRQQLEAEGLTVTEVPSYTAASLAPFDAVVIYGNGFTESNAATALADLETYAQGGGTVIFTPWAGNNFPIPATLQVFSNNGTADFNTAFPGVTIGAPADPLAAGVTPPPPGGFVISRINGLSFVPGATAVMTWTDNGGPFAGRRIVGAGEVIAINMHVITSDSSPEVIQQAWATRLFVNAVGPAAPPPVVVPTLTEWAMILMAVILAGSGAVWVNRRRAATSI